MITITRVTNPAETTELLAHLTLPEEGAVDVFASQLAAIMTQRPESVLVIQARSDMHGLVGFVIADLGPGISVNLRQAWVNPKVGWDVGTELNARVKLWAVSNNRSQIEVRTTRSAEAMYRRFGFEESAKILVQTIPDDFTQRVLDSLKEVANG